VNRIFGVSDRNSIVQVGVCSRNESGDEVSWKELKISVSECILLTQI